MALLRHSFFDSERRLHARVERVEGVFSQGQTGLRVRAELDKSKYPKGREISKAEMATINIYPDAFHGDWNYVIKPRP